MPNLIGASALTLVPTTDGTTEYVYAGRGVPDNAEPERLAQLIEEGFIVDADEPAGGVQNDDPDKVLEAKDVTARKAASLAKAQAKAAEQA